MPHPVFTLLCAVLLSLAMAAVERRTPRERLIAGVRFFVCCLVTVFAGGWLMHWIH